MQTPLTFLAAFVVVLALIGLAAWLVRRFGGNNIGANANRGRMPRLAVIDAAAVDGRRRLVLVRRDNVEHLLMIGGPSDIVIEPNIVRAMPARETATQRPGAAPELSRVPALSDTSSWSEPESDADDRRAGPSFADEVRRPVMADRASTPIPQSAPRPETPRPETPRQEAARQEAPRQEAPRQEAPRVEPSLPRPPRPRAEGAPPPRNPRLTETLGRLTRGPEAAPPAAAKVSPDAEKELTDMAQRLEAALRRPNQNAAHEADAEPAAAEPETQRAPRVSAPDPADAPPSVSRSGFENLEDEMASLLGRPKSPT
jgi:flagellar protein FliO/FliZ